MTAQNVPFLSAKSEINQIKSNQIKHPITTTNNQTNKTQTNANKQHKQHKQHKQTQTKTRQKQNKFENDWKRQDQKENSTT